MRDLTELRKEIDGIDGQLANLFARRMAIAAEVAEAKRGRRQVADYAREREILARMAEAVGPDLENEARILFTTLFSMSRGRQRSALSDDCAFPRRIAGILARTPEHFPSRAIVACPGADGAYAQQATDRFVQFPTILYFKSFDDVFAAVENGMCDYGVLPIENSAVGSVTQVYDQMVRRKFQIIKALRHRIRHVLLANRGVALEDVKEVTSHPFALAQCADFLRTIRGVKTTPAANTAVAAEALAASGRRDVAVIASHDCASIYGLDVISEDISDVKSNYTRFICISRREEIYSDADKISVMMSLNHRPGALSDVLVKFAAVGVNLTKLESRPVPGSDFEVRFIFDFEASLTDPRVVKLLAGFSTDPEVESFTFLGAYSEK